MLEQDVVFNRHELELLPALSLGFSWCRCCRPCAPLGPALPPGTAPVCQCLVSPCAPGAQGAGLQLLTGQGMRGWPPQKPGVHVPDRAELTSVKQHEAGPCRCCSSTGFLCLVWLGSGSKNIIFQVAVRKYSDQRTPSERLH